MKPTFIPGICNRRNRGPLHSQSGVTMILVAISMVAIIAIAALSIDLVTLFLAREEAQRAADAGALAGARVLSVSGMTGDTTSSPATTWACICGGSGACSTSYDGYGFATLAAVSGAGQSTVGGVGGDTIVSPSSVTYSAAGSSNSDCTALPNASAFSVNPMITVQVTRTNLPTFFSRLWGYTGNTVSATATAEAYNPSFSSGAGNGSGGNTIPVQPRCVKPLFVPNQDPWHPAGCTGQNNCADFVDPGTGDIVNRGVSLDGSGTTGVIGENFTLTPDCVPFGHGVRGFCSLPWQPQANTTNDNSSPKNLDYLPGQATNSSVAVPSAATAGNLFEQAIAGCDQTTVYQCGVPYSSANPQNNVDLAENPIHPIGSGDVANGFSALIHEGPPPSTTPNGQDYFNTPGQFQSTPFQILAGTGNPLVNGTSFPSGSPVSASTSIVTIPIYDSTNPNNTISNNRGTTPVTVVGFLQVFVNYVDQYGNVNVTILNVAGCGNGSSGSPSPAVTGTSPVPIRLITPPPTS